MVFGRSEVPTLSLFAGHSGGHLFPALAFAEEYRSRHPQSRLGLVSSIKAKPFAAKMPPGIFDDVYYLPEFPSPSGISLDSLKFLIQLARAFILSWQYLSRFKPDLCVSFGSYAAYPGVLLAAFKKIPTLIHEQNVVPGKATAWLAPHVDCAAVTFSDTFQNRAGLKKVVTGLPIRRALREASLLPKPYEIAGKAGELFHLLVVGGSQGARGLNQLILDAIFQLNPEEKEKIAVTHITGQSDYIRVREEYEKMKFSAKVYPFSENMPALYRSCDLAVTRAGANTLFELALFQTPAFVIPYPHAGAHQSQNSAYFLKRNAILSAEEKSITGIELAGEIRSLMENRGPLKQLSEAISGISNPNAAERLVELADELGGQK